MRSFRLSILHVSLLALLALLALPACDDLPGACPRGRPVKLARALNATTVVVTFDCRVDEASASPAQRYTIGDYSVTPPRLLAVKAAAASDDQVTLTTDRQTALVSYTLKMQGLEDGDGNRLDASVNFTGVGDADAAEITLRVDDRYNANLKGVSLLASVDPVTGVFSPYRHKIALSDSDGDHVFTARLKIAVDPARTADTADDRLGAGYMAYSARAVDSKDRPLSALKLFEVTDAKAKTVSVPLLTVPDPPPPEGLVTVTFKVDDRPARALSKPSLKGSFDAKGVFDASFPTTVALADKDGDDVWEGTARVRIAPDRVLGGLKADTKPYSVTLVEGATPHSARSADFVVPTEKAVSATILIGHKTSVPVTFRVDVAKAWLDTAGKNLGVYSGEAVYLTGEFSVAEDAFGNNATDSFTGGENVVLQMVERTDRPGVWERTIFLPPNRPYGWKVLRCIKDKGCTQINKMVSSSGRAFPTVMKNLATELCDLGKKSWSDAKCKSPKLIDPYKLTKVDTGAGVMDYSKAKIWIGTGAGIKDQADQPGTPKATLMFKQEVPDLVVDVKAAAVQTPVYVVGTWRDVNIPGTPADILSSGTVINLTQTDYDAGMLGARPPWYNLAAPSKPSPFTMDGKLDGTATLLAGGTAGMPIYAAVSGEYLYLATDDAGEGSDNILLISATAPGAHRPAPWGKFGTVAFGGKTLFMADEDDNSFAGWFQLGSTSDVLLETQGGNKTPKLDIFTPATNGGVLEGSIDLKGIFGKAPTMIYLAVAPYGTANKGKMYSAAQTPAANAKLNPDNIDASEILKVSLPQLKVVP